MDFSSVCRACLSVSDLNPIFLDSGTQKRYSTTIYVTSGLKVEPSDGLPQQMCSKCLNFMNESLKFRKQCKETETQLLKHKTECEQSNIAFLEIQVPGDSKVDSPAKTKRFKMEVQVETLSDETVETEVQTDSTVKTLCETVRLTDTAVELLEDFPAENSDSYSEDGRTLEYFSEHFDDGTDKIIFLVQEEGDSDALDNIVNDKKAESEAPLTHPLGGGRVACQLCHLELAARSVHAHMARRHPGADATKIKCELCEKYVSRKKMNRHQKLMHSDGKLICLYCKTEFECKRTLLEHRTSCADKTRRHKVSESGKKMTECDICHKSMQQASLRLHKAIKHAGLGPVCEHCGRRFGNKFRLKEHYRAKHDYEKFKCGRCDFQSASALAMQNHERRHRGEKPFVCEACGAKFHAAYLLAQHRQSHRTEKLLKCDLCPATFKANNNLHMHKASCHSRALFKCHLCARAYSCRHYAVKHARHVHGFSGRVPVLERVQVENGGNSGE